MIYPYKERRSSAESDNIRPAIPPHPFILFLERIGLGGAIEKKHPYPKPLTLESLTQASNISQQAVQKLKITYIDELISFRASPPHHLGVAMKTRAQQLLQTPRGWKKETFGDPGTWLLDPLDNVSCLSIGKFLLNQGRTNLWVSPALTSDFTDAMSKTKNQRVPILGHEKDPYSGRKKPATTIEDLQVYLISMEKFIRQERVEKLARKLVRADNPQYDELLTIKQNALLSKKTHKARKLIDQIDNKTLTWEELNHYLAYLGQRPLDKHDHALIKLFPQDNPLWKIGDLRIEQDSLVLEFSADQFTPRQGAGILENKPEVRINIQKTKEEKLLIIAEEEDLIYLYPLLNSKVFWNNFDREILPLLGNSPYHQIQFMYELGLPTKSITPETAYYAMKNGNVDFIVDIITGIHKTNKRIQDQQYKNGEKNGHHNRIGALINDINQSDLSDTVIRTPKEHELIQNNSFLESLYELALKCSPGHISVNSGHPSHKTINLSETDRKIAFALLKTQSIWKEQMNFPPSTFKLLANIAQGEFIATSAQRTLLMIENQLAILEIPDPISETR